MNFPGSLNYSLEVPAILRPFSNSTQGKHSAYTLSNTTDYWMSENSTGPWNYTICNNKTSCESTNSNSTEHLSGPPLTLWITVILGAMAGIVSLMTILGNAMVLLSFFIERTIRQPTNYFIASLAVSDLLIGTFSMPFFTSYLLLGYWPMGPWLCDLWLSLDWTVCLASQYTVFLITMDRFCSVKLPAKYRTWRTERKVIVMIAVTWVIPVAVFFTCIIGWQFFVGQRTVKYTECEVQFMNDPLFLLVLTIGYFWLTLVVMCVLYSGIYRVALNLQKKSEAKQKKLETAMEMASEQRRLTNVKNLAESDDKTEENKNSDKMVNVTTSFSSKRSSEKDDERSSSPAFASDEENSSQSPRPSKKPSPRDLPKLICDQGIASIGFLPDAKQMAKMTGNSKNNEAKRKANNVSAVAAKPKIADDVQNDKRIKMPNTFIDIYEPSTQPDFSSSATVATLCDKHHSQFSLLPSDVRYRYAEDESFKSLTAAENSRLVQDRVAAGIDTTAPPSPVWRRRSCSNVCDASADYSTQLVDVAQHSVPKVDQSNQLSVSNINTDSVEEVSNGKTMSKLAKEDNAQPYEEEHSLLKSNKRHGSPLQSLVKSVGNKKSRRRSRKEKAKSKSENRARKALRTITFILGAFVLCWTPYHLMIAVIGICGQYSCVNISLYHFTYWLCYLNSPINPFCYAFANVQFKRTFLRILRFDWHRT